MERKVDQRPALHLEHVEDVVDERRAGLPLLHGREAGPALVVERAELAVEDAVRRAERARQCARHRPEPLGQIVAAPARQRGALTRHQPRQRPVAVPLDLVQPPVSRRHVLGRRRRHRLVLGAACARALRGRVPLAEQEPVLRVAVELGRDQGPGALQPLAVQPDGQAAVALLLDELVRAPVPDLHRAGAVLALGDLALEGRVLHGVILDVDGERALPGLGRNAFRHRPARERAVPLEAEVVVEAPGVVALDDEDRLAPLAPGLRGEGLRRLARIALPAVLAQAHGRSSSRADKRKAAVANTTARGAQDLAKRSDFGL